MKKKYKEKLSTKFTESMKNFLIKNDPIMTGNELTTKFNKKFHTNYTKTYLQREARFLGVNALSGKFKKGHKAYNKSPIGHERLKKNKDLIVIKTKENYINHCEECWEYKHIYLYKKYHGEIPKNCVIIFLNRDRRDFSKDNLVAVDKDVFRLASSALLIPKERCDKEITRTGILIAQLYMKINQLKKKAKGIK